MGGPSARYVEVVCYVGCFFFFFQAEDGIRDIGVTGVQTCALPIFANGVTLNPGQVQLVRELATSGARVQLALAPAATGKTTALRTLSAAWRTGGGNVVGLAPSAAAATVLREQIGTDTDTLAKLLHPPT